MGLLLRSVGLLLKSGWTALGALGLLLAAGCWQDQGRRFEFAGMKDYSIEGRAGVLLPWLRESNREKAEASGNWFEGEDFGTGEMEAVAAGEPRGSEIVAAIIHDHLADDAAGLE